MSDRWIGLDFRHLLTLRAIADEGSFKAAARALGYTPSAVSQQIASLERVVGIQLIAREHGRQAFGLTEAGRILLRHLAAIEARLGAAKADIDALAQGAAGTLRVGAYESVSARLLPELSGPTSRSGIRIRASRWRRRLRTSTTSRRWSGARSTSRSPCSPSRAGPFRARAVLRDPWVLVVQAGSPLVGHAARRPSISSTSGGSPSSASARRGRSTTRSTGSGARDRAQHRASLRLQRRRPGVRRLGRGVALMPRLAVNRRDARTAIVELGGLDSAEGDRAGLARRPLVERAGRRRSSCSPPRWARGSGKRRGTPASWIGTRRGHGPRPGARYAQGPRRGRSRHAPASGRSSRSL